MKPSRVCRTARTLEWLEGRVSMEPMSGCWPWLGWCNAAGYGYTFPGSGAYLAHRLAYEINNGPIPDGLFVCHRCDNPPCVNPAHLFAGTAADNIRDMMRKGRFRHSIPPESRQRGESHVRAKLTDADVISIRSRLAAGEQRMVIAREYGLGWTTVNHIAAGRTWRHLLAPAGALVSVEER